MGLSLVLLRHCPPHGRGRLLHLGLAAALHLDRHHQPLVAADLHPESRRPPCSQRRVAAFRRDLDVLGVEVAAPQNDQVLSPPGEHQPAAVQKAQIAGAQIRPGAPGARRPAVLPRSRKRQGAERRRGLRRPAPVARRHARPSHPDLPHLARPARPPGLGVDDPHHLAGRRRPAPHQLAHRARHRRHREAPAQRLGVAGHHLRPALPPPARHQQRGLGQAVARHERRAPEAAARERRRETLESRRPHRLGAVERHLPVRQVEPGALGRADPPHAQVVGEVGPAAGRRAVAGDRPQPAHRRLQEGRRRHQDAGRAGPERLEHVADQPHVVEQRQPADDHRALVLAEGLLDRPLVVHQIAVGDGDALGGGGRARGVLEEGEVVARQLGQRRGRTIGAELERIDREHRRTGEVRALGGEALGAAGEGGGSEHQPRPGVGGDREQPLVAPTRAGGGGRHGHRAGPQAAQECGHEIEPGGVEQQGALARRPGLGEDAAKDGRAVLDAGESQAAGFGLAVRQEAERQAVRVLRRAPPEDVEEGAGIQDSGGAWLLESNGRQHDLQDGREPARRAIRVEVLPTLKQGVSGIYCTRSCLPDEITGTHGGDKLK